MQGFQGSILLDHVFFDDEKQPDCYVKLCHMLALGLVPRLAKHRIIVLMTRSN